MWLVVGVWQYLYHKQSPPGDYCVYLSTFDDDFMHCCCHAKTASNWHTNRLESIEWCIPPNLGLRSFSFRRSNRWPLLRVRLVARRLASCWVARRWWRIVLVLGKRWGGGRSGCGSGSSDPQTSNCCLLPRTRSHFVPSFPGAHHRRGCLLARAHRRTPSLRPVVSHFPTVLSISYGACTQCTHSTTTFLTFRAIGVLSFVHLKWLGSIYEGKVCVKSTIREFFSPSSITEPLQFPPYMVKYCRVHGHFSNGGLSFTPWLKASKYSCG